MTEFLWLSLPLIAGVLFFAASFFGTEAILRYLIKPAGALCKNFGLDITSYIENPPPFIMRSMLLLIGIGCFAYPAFRDYSHFFPQRFDIVVFFDDDGLTRALTQFDSEDLSSLNLEEDWMAKRSDYFDHLNSELQAKGIPFKFDRKKGATIGKGEGIFQAKIIDRWGVQRYHIIQAKGTIDLITRVKAGDDAQKIETRYELLPSDMNTIEATLFDIYIKHGLIIKPEFWQTIRLSPTVTMYDHSLIAVTKVKVWPAIDIGRTIYLYRKDNRNMPIGYAIYTPSQ